MTARSALVCVYLWLNVFVLVQTASAAGAPPLTIRQNHLFFQFGHEENRAICGVQEIVVVVAAQDSDEPLMLSVPADAQRVAPMPVPPVMPGAESNRPLEDREVEISPGQIVIKRKLLAGKNTFSFGYVLPAGPQDSVRLEKRVLLPTFLLAAFAPKVKRITSGTLEIEEAEDGYRILGRNLPAGSTIDLTFEGVHDAISTGPDRRDGGGSAPAAMPTGPADPRQASSAPQMLPKASFSLYLFPSIAGVMLGVMVFSYAAHARKRKEAVEEFRRFLMDEIDALDAAAEKKEIQPEFHRKKKKILMDRLRSMPS